MSRRLGALTAAGLVVAAIVVVTVLSSGDRPAAKAQPTAPASAKVERGELSAGVSGTGTLTYRASPDGSPYTVVNRAGGVYTRLPAAGDRIGCGGALYRVDNRPVVLLCGTVPAYRDLHLGAAGPDVAQLNRNLGVAGRAFTAKTEQSLKTFQGDRGQRVTGALAGDDAVFLPEPVRVAKVTAALGGAARPGVPLLSATSSKLHVRVDLDASQQGEVHGGDRVQVTLPGNTAVAGRVAGFGRIARAAQGGQAAAATIPTFIDLDRPAKARGLDQAPVDIDITTKGVHDALSVPVTALVGRSGGGYAVEIVRTGGRRELVAVTLGLFDTGGGRVQVEGDVRAGDAVTVPSI